MNVVASLNITPVSSRCAAASNIGPNGAGKSTLIDAVAGFKACAGTVALGTQRLGSVSAHGRARLGLRRSFQQDRTIPDLSVEQYLRLLAGRDLGRAEVLDVLQFLDGPRPEHLMDTVDVGTRRLVKVAGLQAARRAAREVPEVFGCAA